MGERLHVIVCGSRDGAPAGTPWTWVDRALGSFDRDHARLVHLIVGGAKGIDQLAEAWALQNERVHTVIPAAWSRLGKAAGPMRNAEMLAFLTQCSEAATRAVLAFPGGVGTEDMVAKARSASVPVWRCSLVGTKGWRWDRG